MGTTTTVTLIIEVILRRLRQARERYSPAMSQLDGLRALTGAWDGEYVLTVEPGTPHSATFTNADVEIVAGGKLVTVFYDWEDPTTLGQEGREDGLLLISGYAAASGEPWAGTPLPTYGGLAPVELPQPTWLSAPADSVPSIVEVTWCDSWHMDDRMMQLRGEGMADGGFSVAGSYTLPDGVAWGWRVELEISGSDAFAIRMFNVTPEGEEHPAVHASYRRSAAAEE